MDDLERARGCIVGAAIGDALGMPTEDISRQLRDYLYGGLVTSYVQPHKNHPCAHLKPGQYTDDTQQMMLLAKSLVECSGFDVEDFAKRFAQWGWYCKTIPRFNRYAGGASASAAMALNRGVSIEEAASPASNSCGAAMRVAPVSVFYKTKSIDVVLDIAERQARLSHKAKEAVQAAQVIASVIYYVQQGASPVQSVELSMVCSDGELNENLNQVSVRRDELPFDIAQEIGATQKAVHAVPMALHCFLHSPGDFEQTVINAANLVQGDTDSIACMAGAMSGAYVGFSNISARFLEQLENKELLVKLAEQLCVSR